MMEENDMNNKLYNLFILFFISANLVSAQVSQVVKNFENADKGTDGFYISVGNNFTVLNQRTDAKYGGVLEAQINSDSAATSTVEVDYFDQFWTSSMEGANFLTVDLFVPDDFPDSASIQLWEMDHTNWNWKSTSYSPSNINGGRTMVKGKWNTFVFEIKRQYQNDPDHYFPWNVKMGLEMKIFKSWKGSVLIDNVTLWSTANVLDDFAQDMNGWANWGDVFAKTPFWVNHPQYGGVAEIEVANNTNQKINGGINLPNIVLGWTTTTSAAVIMALDIYIPQDIPDSSYIQFYNMDQSHWNWKRTIYSPKILYFGDSTTAIKKGAWNTMAFEIQQQYYVDPGNYNPWDLIQAGIEINIPSAYSGTFYIDNLRLYSKNDLVQTKVSNDENLPLKYNLEQNYPNPFNPGTTINFSLPKFSTVQIKIYDALGREVRSLISEEKSAGSYNILWDGKNNYGSRVSSGVYLYTIHAGDFYQSKKMLLLK